MQEKLKSPEARFDPDAAKAMHTEVKGLQSDIAQAADEIAESRAELSSVRAELDKTHKETAAFKRKFEDAQAEASNFKKQLAAASALNVDSFNVEDLDFEELEAMFGQRGIAKLREVLAVPNFDVRGRLQRLQGFFSVITQSTWKSLKPFLQLIETALEKLRGSGSKWVAVLAPWVNMLLKDLVLMDMKDLKHYRSDLQLRIDTVLKADPSASLKEKLRTQPVDKRTWKSTLKTRQQRFYTAWNHAKASLSRFSSHVGHVVGQSISTVTNVVGPPIGATLAATGKILTASGRFARITFKNAKIFIFTVLVVSGLKEVKIDKGKGREVETFERDETVFDEDYLGDVD